MSLDLNFDFEQQLLADSVRRFCENSELGPKLTHLDPLPSHFWTGLSELGVLGLGTVDGGGGAVEIVAAMEQLGSYGAPGPLVATFIGGTLLSGPSLKNLIDGTALVAIGARNIMPWAFHANYFIEIEMSQAWLVNLVAPIETVQTLTGEVWGQTTFKRVEEFENVELALSRGDIASAAYLVGAAQRLLDITADYARDRVQFNKSIGNFQAVAHPLATSLVSLTAAKILTRTAAFYLDNEDPLASQKVGLARLSASRVASTIAYQAHQIFGAIGFTVEGPVAHIAQKIRQLCLTPPGAERSRRNILPN